MKKQCYNFGTEKLLCLISGFRRKVTENCALLGYYTASKRKPVAPIRSVYREECGQWRVSV